MKLIQIAKANTDIVNSIECLLSLNAKTSKYGLILTQAQARELAIVHDRSLCVNERIEIGLGAPELLIETFSKSRYASPDNWSELLCELCDLFYYIKSEICDRVSDRELVDVLFGFFENQSQGSLELMASRELESFLRYVYNNYINIFSRDKTISDDILDDRIGRAEAFGEDDRDSFHSSYKLDPDDDYSLIDYSE